MITLSLANWATEAEETKVIWARLCFALESEVALKIRNPLFPTHHWVITAGPGIVTQMTQQGFVLQKGLLEIFTGFYSPTLELSSEEWLLSTRCTSDHRVTQILHHWFETICGPLSDRKQRSVKAAAEAWEPFSKHGRYFHIPLTQVSMRTGYVTDIETCLKFQHFQN